LKTHQYSKKLFLAIPRLKDYEKFQTATAFNAIPKILRKETRVPPISCQSTQENSYA
jgi:hypothetical protein